MGDQSFYSSNRSIHRGLVGQERRVKERRHGALQDTTTPDRRGICGCLYNPHCVQGKRYFGHFKLELMLSSPTGYVPHLKRH